MLLSCASVGLFRPVWQSEIEEELRRNGIRLLEHRGIDQASAAAALDHTLTQMNSAFPDARLPSRRWRRHIETMSNHPKDRHVLAAAVGAGASHVVSENTRHFPVRARPPGLIVQKAQPFLRDLLDQQPELLLAAASAMTERNRRPPRRVEELARQLIASERLPVFGAELLAAVRRQGR